MQNSYRTNLTKILQKIQALYQNGLVNNAQKNELVALAKEGLSSDDMRLEFASYVKRLSRRINGEFGFETCLEILSMIGMQ